VTTVVEKVVKKTSGEPPRFVRPIQPCVVRDGDSCQFSAAVAGVPVPEISWLKDKVGRRRRRRTRTRIDNDKK